MNFSTDPALELFTPVLNGAGQTAFYGATTDGGLGFWSEGSGSLAPVARSGQQAPGTPAGVTFTFSNLYNILETPILNDAGHATFRSHLSGAGVTSAERLRTVVGRGRRPRTAPDRAAKLRACRLA